MQPTQGKATIPSSVFDTCGEDGRFALGHVLLVPGSGGNDAWAVTTDGRFLTCRHIGAKVSRGAPVLLTKQECSRDALFDVEISEATKGKEWKPEGADRTERFPLVMDAIRTACPLGAARAVVFLDAELLVQMQRALSPGAQCLRLVIGDDRAAVLVTGERGIGCIMPKAGDAKFVAAEIGIAEELRERLLNDYEVSLAEPEIEIESAAECLMIS